MAGDDNRQRIARHGIARKPGGSGAAGGRSQGAIADRGRVSNRAQRGEDGLNAGGKPDGIERNGELPQAAGAVGTELSERSGEDASRLVHRVVGACRRPFLLGIERDLAKAQVGRVKRF